MRYLLATCCASVLGGAVLVFLLAGYFAQQYLPPPKPKVVGIDLGKIQRTVLVFFMIIYYYAVRVFMLVVDLDLHI